MPFDGQNIPQSERTRTLKKAYSLLEEGFTTRQRCFNGSYCSLGALSMAKWGDPDIENPAECVELLYRHTQVRPSKSWDNAHMCMSQTIVDHNNKLGRGPTLEMFRNAIAESEQLDAMIALSVTA